MAPSSCVDPAMRDPYPGWVNPHVADQRTFEAAQRALRENSKAARASAGATASAGADEPPAELFGEEDEQKLQNVELRFASRSAATSAASTSASASASASSVGADAPLRFFPTLGNHDWGTYSGVASSAPERMPYFQYFPSLLELSPHSSAADAGAGQYWTVSTPLEGVQLFSVNSNLGGPGASPPQQLLFSEQTSWLKGALRNSSAPFKIVQFHHPPFCSAQHDPLAPWMDLDYEGWGASAVFVGHEHVYERLVSNEARPDGTSPPSMPYIVNGLGGHPWTYAIEDCPAYPGSQIRYDAFHGLQLAILSWDTTRQQQRIDVCFYSMEAGGTLVDQFTIPISATAA